MNLNFMLDFANSNTFRSVENVNLIPLGLFTVLKQASFIVLVISLVVWLMQVFAELSPILVNQNLIPVSLAKLDKNLLYGSIQISLALWVISVIMLAFVNQKLTRAGSLLKPGCELQQNLLEYLDFEAARIVKSALRHSHLPFSKVLLYKILKTNRLTFALRRLCVDDKDLKHQLLEKMKQGSKTFSRDNETAMALANNESCRHVLERAAQISLDCQQEKISIFTLFMVLCEEEERFIEVMDKLQLQKEDVDSVVLWQMRMESYRKFRGRFWEKDNLRLALPTSPVQLLIGGYTITLDLYSHDLTLYNPLRQGGVVLHENEIQSLEESFLKEKGNGVLLVGEIGSGRSSIIYNFANRILSESSLGRLKFLRILELDMIALLASSKEESFISDQLNKIFNEAIDARNIVLVIPQIHNYIGLNQNFEKNVGQIDISAIINKYINRPGFRFIGITTFDGLHRSVEHAAEFIARLKKIEVSPVSPQDAMRVLKEESLRRERKDKVFIPISSLKEIVNLSDYYIGAAAFPAKAVDFLDELVSNKLNQAQFKKSARSIMPDEVDAVFSRKYNVPAGTAGQKEKEILLNLEDHIHEGLINQKEAVFELANALRRARAQVKTRKRTIGNFLFLGPTGVGKTETAKQLARVYFGSPKNIIRLNMAEYQTIDALDRLIGTPQTPGVLTSAVRDNPFSLILIDEIEKANASLLNVFLSVFDEGQLNDGAGQPVDFRHTIIIATSNAGAEYIKEAVDRGSTLANLKDSLVDNLLRRQIFNPEFLNRFDAVVLYRPLNEAEMQQVAILLLNDVVDGLHQKRIELLVTPELTATLSRMGYDPAFGARALRRVIQNRIEDAIARALLSGKIKSGDTCEFDLRTWDILVSPKERQEYHEQKAQIREEDDPMAATLIRLEDRIHEGLINQSEAISELANALRRSHANLKESKRTIGNFLFLGPTGVGKTETAKQLAKVFFGSAKNMIRLNMAEYQNLNSIDKLIGNLQSPGQLTTQIIENPQSLILIDEIEKASPQILNLFLSVFDDGQLADGTGRIVDFKKSIMIATSNAGAEYIKEAVEKRDSLSGEFKKKFIDELLRRGIFSPEFINRFDAVVLYRSLNNDEMKNVAALMLKDIQAGLAVKGIIFRIGDALVTRLVGLGFDPVFGGRAMRRTIQDKVENAIASALLSRRIRKGDVIEIDPLSWQTVIIKRIE